MGARGPKCKACTSGQRDALNHDTIEALLGKRHLADVAQTYGLSRHVVERHAHKCVKPLLQAEADQRRTIAQRIEPAAASEPAPHALAPARALGVQADVATVAEERHADALLEQVHGLGDEVRALRQQAQELRQAAQRVLDDADAEDKPERVLRAVDRCVAAVRTCDQAIGRAAELVELQARLTGRIGGEAKSGAVAPIQIDARQYLLQVGVDPQDREQVLARIEQAVLRNPELVARLAARLGRQVQGTSAAACRAGEDDPYDLSRERRLDTDDPEGP